MGYITESGRASMLGSGKMMDNTQKFTGKADIYAKYRPSYPVEAVKFILGKIHADEPKIADIGAGTGIFTELLLKNTAENTTICAVEPNEDMRRKMQPLIQSYDNLYVIGATAENSTLPDKGFDLVTVAQAFHWFDEQKFRRECQRILKSNGVVALVWNSRERNAKMTDAYYDILKKYCESYNHLQNTRPYTQDFSRFFGGEYTTKLISNPIPLDKGHFINHTLSASYSLKPEDKAFEEYMAELESYFEKYQENGIITIANVTEIYIGGLK